MTNSITKIAGDILLSAGIFVAGYVHCAIYQPPTNASIIISAIWILIISVVIRVYTINNRM